MEKSLKLITESNLEGFKVITESAGIGKPQTIKMEGVYIMTDEPNGNGRTYRSEDMIPAVNKFIKEKINTKTALEELEHPECQLLRDFEILGENGFVWFDDIKVDDMVWTRNPITKKAELKPVLRKIDQNYSGNGYIVTGSNFHGEFTANHRFVTEDRYGNLEIQTIEEIYNNRSRYHNNSIPKTLNINDDISESTSFTIPSCKSHSSSRTGKRNDHERFEEDLVIDKMAFCKLFGFWLAEGGSKLHQNDNGCSGGCITITQSVKRNKEVCDLIDNLIEDLPQILKDHTRTFISSDGSKITWMITDLRLAKYFHDCGNIYTKRIPKEVLCFGKCYLEQLVYYFGLGDGRKTVHHLKKYNNLLLDSIKDVFSVSEGLIDDLSYCILKCGISTSKRCVIDKNDYIFANHVVKVENKHPLWVASLLTSSNVALDKRMLKIEKIECVEEDQYGAYCIQVENTSFFMRNKGKCYWTGNCITINPDRVCAKTVSLRQDGNAWVGQSVVLATDEKYGIVGTKCGDLLKSLLQFDVACGHSSRGVGNVNESTGVVEDYQLVCIDTVLSPSIGIFNKSNANRFTNGILESKQFVVGIHGELIEKPFDDFEKKISKMPNTNIGSKKADFLGEAVTEFFKSFIGE